MEREGVRDFRGALWRLTELTHSMSLSEIHTG